MYIDLQKQTANMDSLAVDMLVSAKQCSSFGPFWINRQQFKKNA
jgi:hypothetical protein